MARVTSPGVASRPQGPGADFKGGRDCDEHILDPVPRAPVGDGQSLEIQKVQGPVRNNHNPVADETLGLRNTD